MIFLNALLYTIIILMLLNPIKKIINDQFKLHGTF